MEQVGEGGERFVSFTLLHAKEGQKTLASPIPHLQFLLALSELDPSNSVLSTISKKQTPRQTSASVFPSNQGEAHAASSSKTTLPSKPLASDWKGKGKSKADILKAWRTSQCKLLDTRVQLRLARPPFPEHLLLRDTLYLLQGIDGRYVRFAVRPPKEKNPYRTDRGLAGDGAGFALGNGDAESDGGEEGEVIGIDFVVDEAKVSHSHGQC